MQNEDYGSESNVMADDDADVSPATPPGDKSPVDLVVNESEDREPATVAFQRTGRGHRLASDSEVADRPKDGVAQIINMINNRKFVASAINKQPISSDAKRQLSVTRSDVSSLPRVRALVQNIESRHSKFDASVQRTSKSPITRSAADVLPVECPSIAARRRELMSSAQQRPIQRNRTIYRSSGYAGMRSVALRKDSLLKRATGSATSGEKSSTVASSRPSAARPCTLGSGRNIATSNDEASVPHRSDNSPASALPSTFTCGLESVLVNKFSVEPFPVSGGREESVRCLTISSDADAGSTAHFTSLSNQLSQSLDSLAAPWTADKGTMVRTASADVDVNTAGACGLRANEGQADATLIIGPRSCRLADETPPVRSLAKAKSKFVDEWCVGRRSQTLPLSACGQSIHLDTFSDEHLC